jgi:LuxR family maltose regulon positive regulatory protein
MYHVVHDMAIHDLMNELLRHPPRPLHLVLMTRRDPPLALATLRARDRMTELRQQDLRFTVVETTMFLEQMTDLKIVDTVAATLQDRIEGWVIGLRLAALFHRHHGNLNQLLYNMPGQVAYVSEYLMSEVLSQQPREVQDFLMQTSILNRFCAPLCDAVRGEGPLGSMGTRRASPPARPSWNAYTRRTCFSFPKATSRSGIVIVTITCFRRSCRASYNADTIPMR